MIKVTLRAVTKALSSFLLCAALVVPVIAESAPINTDEADLAVKGYDVVAYFTEGRPVEGKSEFEYSWQNARWRFSAAANRDLFAANPERYVPQYGGFCAYCLVARGRLRDSNPKSWTIISGKLYLNRSMFQRTQWRESKVSYIKQADDAWAKLTGEKAKITRPKDEKAPEAFKLAIFPFKELAGWSLGAFTEVLGVLTHKVVIKNRSLDLVYSYYAEDNADVTVDVDKVWRGESARKEPNEELIYELGGELGVDAVLLFKWKPEVTSGSSPAPPSYWDAEIYLLDIGLRRVYHEPESRLVRGDLEKATSTVFSRFVEGRKLTGHKIAIFPFNDATVNFQTQVSSSRTLAALAGRVIRGNRSLDLVYSYYSAEDSVDQIVDAQKIWRGSSSRKQPNEDLIYELGAELGVNAVLLLQYRWRVHNVLGPPTAWDAEIYLFDIGSRRVFHEPERQLATGSIGVSDVEKATSPVLSRFLEGRDQVSQAQ